MTDFPAFLHSRYSDLEDLLAMNGYAIDNRSLWDEWHEVDPRAGRVSIKGARLFLGAPAEDVTFKINELWIPQDAPWAVSRTWLHAGRLHLPWAGRRVPPTRSI